MAGFEREIPNHESKEYDSDETEALALLHPRIDFNELKRRSSAAFGVSCTRVKSLAQGDSHILFVLFFGSRALDAPTGPDILSEWSCIARFTQQMKSMEKMTSELETMLYVRSKTTIPVPEIYLYDFNPNNSVGAPFILMQRMPGCHLYEIWNGLSIKHKEVVLTQIAGVLAKLSSVTFDKIGCLQKDGLGPILNFIAGSKGPFTSTYDYCISFLPDAKSGISPCQEIKSELKTYLMAHKGEPHLRAPYCLIHPDFDGKNMIFVHDKDSKYPPKLSGIIDWEHAYTGPLYYLYEYPIFIQDPYTERESYEENASLRFHFAHALCQQFPEAPSKAQAARFCLQSKCRTLGMSLCLETQVIVWRGKKC